MKKVSKIFVIFMIFCIMIANFYTLSSAKVVVNKETLTKAFEDFVKVQKPEERYEIEVEDEEIVCEFKDEIYKIKYNLTNNPTFEISIHLENGMSYNEFEEKTDNMILPMSGYVTTANVQGVPFEDSMAYFILNFLEKVLEGANGSQNKYIIIDDLDIDEGVTIDKTDDPNIIYTSEFPERVMDFVQDVYGKNMEIDDKDIFNTFSWKTSLENKTEDSCDLVSKITVNLDGDFSKLKGYASSSDNKDEEDDKKEENKSENKNQNKNENKVNTNKNTNTDNTIANKIIPAAGKEKIVVCAIGLTIIALIVWGIKVRSYKDVK